MLDTRINVAVTISSAVVVLFIGLTPLPGTGNSASAETMTARAVRAVRQSVQGSAVTETVLPQADELALRTELPSVHFDFASSAIRPADRSTLDANARWLQANAGHSVVLEGGADPRGSTPYNLALAKRRAQTVRDYLVARGVAPERIAMLSTGEGRLACAGADCWLLDRRVDFVVKGITKQAP